MKVLTVRDLGMLIRHQRQKLGIDQATLAERAGVSRYWIIGIEGGKERADVGLVLRTLRALGLNVDVSDDKPRRARGPAGTTTKPTADDLIKSALARRR